MLFVLVVLAYLYISPVRTLVRRPAPGCEPPSQVVALERTAGRLHAQERALAAPSTLESEARNLGLVRPGEREYVVQRPARQLTPASDAGS